MALAAAHAGEHTAADLLLHRWAVEKGDVLRPRDADQHLQPVLAGDVEQPDRRHGEDACRIRPHLGHQRKILRDALGRRKLRAVGAGGERTVGHALDEMLLAAGEEELALDLDRRRSAG